MNKRELKEMSLEERKEALQGRKVTFTSSLTKSEEEVLIRTVVDYKDPAVLHFIGPNGHRWVLIKNITKVSKKKA